MPFQGKKLCGQISASVEISLLCSTVVDEKGVFYVNSKGWSNEIINPLLDEMGHPTAETLNRDI